MIDLKLPKTAANPDTIRDLKVGHVALDSHGDVVYRTVEGFVVLKARDHLKSTEGSHYSTQYNLSIPIVQNFGPFNIVA